MSSSPSTLPLSADRRWSVTATIPKDRDARCAGHSFDLRAGAEHDFSVAGAWLGGGLWRAGDRSWRQRARLLRLSGLPAGIPCGVRAARRAGDARGRRRAARCEIKAPLLHMSKADIIRAGLSLGLDYGLTHSCYDPAPSGRPCGAATVAVCVRAASRRPASPIRCCAESRSDRAALLHRPVPRRVRRPRARVEPHDGRPAAVLDRTAFYPTSGGQPFDTGASAARRWSTSSIARTARFCTCSTVTSSRGRARHDRLEPTVRTHAAAHRATRAVGGLRSTAEARTESFHLGSASSTIDLNRAVSAGEIERAEDEANRVVWEDRPVSDPVRRRREAAQLPLRKESAREGTLRLIEVADFDISACGGTHVARTGAIGAIAVQSTERFRGGTRVEFLCGVRVLRGLPGASRYRAGKRASGFGPAGRIARRNRAAADGREGDEAAAEGSAGPAGRRSKRRRSPSGPKRRGDLQRRDRGAGRLGSERTEGHCRRDRSASGPCRDALQRAAAVRGRDRPRPDATIDSARC